MANIKKILIVCTGNSCRSPMAEGFLKQCLRPESGFEIISSGTSAVGGFHPTREAIEVMKEDNIDISAHRTRPFSGEDADKADIILVMSGLHKDFILRTLPELKDKVFLYKEFAEVPGGDKDIADPIGQPLSFYKTVKEEIKRASIKIVNKIKGELK